MHAGTVTAQQDLTLAEAAQMFDVSVANLRMRVVRGEIPGYQQRALRGRVWMVSVAALEEAGYTRRAAPTAAPATVDAEVARLQDLLLQERARSAELDNRLGYALLTVGRLKGRLRKAGINPDDDAFGGYGA